MEEQIVGASETATQGEEKKIVKVRIPTGHLITLHFLKLTKQLDMSEIVARALREYFTAHPVSPERAASAVAGN